jgi:hypothetical protein
MDECFNRCVDKCMECSVCVLYSVALTNHKQQADTGGAC